MGAGPGGGVSQGRAWLGGLVGRLFLGPVSRLSPPLRHEVGWSWRSQCSLSVSTPYPNSGLRVFPETLQLWQKFPDGTRFFNGGMR